MRGAAAEWEEEQREDEEDLHSWALLFRIAPPPPPPHPHLSPWALRPHKDTLSTHRSFQPHCSLFPAPPQSLVLWLSRPFCDLSTSFQQTSFLLKSVSPFLFLAVIKPDSLQVFLEEYLVMLRLNFFVFQKALSSSPQTFEENTFFFITK